MTNVLFFITGLSLGICVVITLLSKPLKFEVHHKYETLTPDPNMDELEAKMFTEDSKRDKMYDEDKNIHDVLAEVNDVMGGSDR